MQPRVVILWLASRCRARVATPFRSCPRPDIRVASYRDHVPTGRQARGHAEAGTSRHRGRGGPRRAQVLASPALLQRPLGFGPSSAPVPPAPVCLAGSVPSEHRPPAARLCPVSGARNASPPTLKLPAGYPCLASTPACQFSRQQPLLSVFFSLLTHWRGQVLGVHPESGVRCYSRAEPCPPSPDRHRCLISICRPSRINGLDAPADPPGPTFLVPFWVGTRVAGHPLLCVLNSRLVFAPRGPHSCTGRGLGNSSSSPTDQRVQFFHAASSLLVFGSNWKCLALHLDSVSTPSSPIGGVTLQRARSLGGASTLFGTSSIRPPPSFQRGPGTRSQFAWIPFPTAVLQINITTPSSALRSARAYLPLISIVRGGVPNPGFSSFPLR